MKKIALGKPLKILIIAEDKFPPFRVDVQVLFGEEMSGRGYHIDWLLQSEKDCTMSYQTEWNSGRIWVGATDNGTRRWNRFKKNLLNIYNKSRVWWLTEENTYDLILVKDEFLSALLAIMVAKRYKTKFLCWLSYPFPEAWIHRAKEGTARYPLLYFLRGYIFKFLLYKIIMPAANHVFVQSEQMKKDIMAEEIPEAKITAVPMGVQLEKIPFKNLSRPQPQVNRRRVLYLGTLSKVRKMDFLVRVFVRVLQDVPFATLYLVGSGDDPSDERVLVEEINRLGIQDSVVMTGFLPMAEAWQFVSEADVCVSPFYPTFILNSTSPTKLIEYMALGKPVVANDHPEQHLVLTQSGGGLCVPYDEDSFAGAIVTLLRDPLMREEMGRKGRMYIEQNRSYRVIADMVDRKLKQVIGN